MRQTQLPRVVPLERWRAASGPPSPRGWRTRELFPALAAVLVVLFSLPARAADDADVGERRRVYLLIKDLGDEKPTVRDEAERALARMGDAVLDEVIAALANRHRAVRTMDPDRRPVARARAAKLLGGIGGDRAGKHLTAALRDRSPLVRRTACSALGDMEWKPAVPELIEIVENDSPAVAGDAVLALGAIGDKAAVKPLRRTLANPATLERKYKDDDHVARIRAGAAFALGMIGDTRAAPDLLTALDDEAARVRQHADRALRLMSGESMGFKANDSEEQRRKAVKAWRVYWNTKLK
ncbi:MAG: HEAT repeat domain-containing protein [Planctomycetota bacterium]